ncbi:hypothetical protein E2562_022787 [Oryza meyeriana var. granulata]|uniref:Uncharacterized protein n=1 Tax=Oryza meyeriana var. granulata TaxID=110450 RepID=A0A6G1EYD0_9ORYZ|nr:hypothetical protein E2562_022787 [Oryza meyeriana var. granulata]
MPEKVKKVTFTGSQSECEIILQETQAEQPVNPGDRPPQSASTLETEGAPSKPSRKRCAETQPADVPPNEITPLKISIVMGTPFGGEELRLADGKFMGVVSKQLARDLGLQPNAKISRSRLIHEIREKKNNPNAVHFFIMVMTNKLLLPTTDFYVTHKDAYLGKDLARAARIDWSKAVFNIRVQIPHLPTDVRLPVIDAIGVYDRQAKVDAYEIAMQIRLVQTR